MQRDRNGRGLARHIPHHLHRNLDADGAILRHTSRGYLYSLAGGCGDVFDIGALAGRNAGTTTLRIEDLNPVIGKTPAGGKARRRLRPVEILRLHLRRRIGYAGITLLRREQETGGINPPGAETDKSQKRHIDKKPGKKPPALAAANRALRTESKRGVAGAGASLRRLSIALPRIQRRRSNGSTRLHIARFTAQFRLNTQIAVVRRLRNGIDRVIILRRTFRCWWAQLLLHPVQKTVALFILDLVDQAFKPLPLLGDDLRIVYPLLAQACFQRLTGRLVNPCTNFGVRSVRFFQSISNCRFQSAHDRSLFYYALQKICGAAPWVHDSVTAIPPLRKLRL
ncbi:hypothetical protein D3C71_1103470 [compost metagenome]